MISYETDWKFGCASFKSNFGPSCTGVVLELLKFLPRRDDNLLPHDILARMLARLHIYSLSGFLNLLLEIINNVHNLSLSSIE